MVNPKTCIRELTSQSTQAKEGRKQHTLQGIWTPTYPTSGALTAERPRPPFLVRLIRDSDP